MKLSIGPVLYFWPASVLDAFYERVLSSSADIVYLGEIVCAKRRTYSTQRWLEWAERLSLAGKEVVLSSLTLIESEAELGAMKQLCAHRHVNMVSNFMVEANDMGMVQLAMESQRPFTAGNTLNIYNAATLKHLVTRGLKRWTPPLEMSRVSLEALLQEYRQLCLLPVQTEVFSYGRLPLAHSARCYTARLLNIPKDQCEFRCIEYPEGTPLYSQEGQGLFQINGIQTQSFQTCNLLSQWHVMEALGIAVMRFSASDPSCLDRMDELKQCMNGSSTGLPPIDEPACNGYWFGKPGMECLNEAV